MARLSMPKCLFVDDGLQSFKLVGIWRQASSLKASARAVVRLLILQGCALRAATRSRCSTSPGSRNPVAAPQGSQARETEKVCLCIVQASRLGPLHTQPSPRPVPHSGLWPPCSRLASGTASPASPSIPRGRVMLKSQRTILRRRNRPRPGRCSQPCAQPDHMPRPSIRYLANSKEHVSTRSS